VVEVAAAEIALDAEAAAASGGKAGASQAAPICPQRTQLHCPAG
jgi:hypothetical protein